VASRPSRQKQIPSSDVISRGSSIERKFFQGKIRRGLISEFK
jgi:hypothetical protein